MPTGVAECGTRSLAKHIQIPTASAKDQSHDRLPHFF